MQHNIELQMGLQDVALLPPKLVITPHFLNIMVEVKASGPQHVLKLWLGVGKGMLPAKYSCFNKSYFVSVLFF